jgi:hypothetical protein
MPTFHFNILRYNNVIFRLQWRDGCEEQRPNTAHVTRFKGFENGKVRKKNRGSHYHTCTFEGRQVLCQDRLHLSEDY